MLPERLARSVVYESPWVSLYVDRIRLGTGRVIERMHVVHVDQPGVATILEDDRGRVAMVRVPRHATGTNDWELPEGRAAAGEPPIDAALREAQEETGWSAEAPELLHTFHPLPGLSDHVMHVVRARAVAEVGDVDRDEIDEVRWFALDELRALLAERRVLDGFTMLALFLHLQDRA
jgi:8-oxo-dGTP pyrophosphatase MutT (NUDIX family)